MSEADDKSTSNCCEGQSAGTGTSCCCGGKPKSGFDFKTLIFVVVMAAAMGVGMYSFWGKSPACATGTACDSTGGSCCPSAVK